jgi:fermentation-respiration switch protein FrsA (DUF1100 family)
MLGFILGLALAATACAAAGVFYLARHAVIRGTAHGSPRARLPPSPDYPLLTLPLKDGTTIAAQFGRAMDAPILLVYGTESELVSAAMVDRLAAAATAKVTRLPIAGAGHFNLFQVGGAGLGRSIGDWIAAPARESPAPK